MFNEHAKGHSGVHMATTDWSNNLCHKEHSESYTERGLACHSTKVNSEEEERSSNDFVEAYKDLVVSATWDFHLSFFFIINLIIFSISVSLKIGINEYYPKSKQYSIFI